MLRPFIICLFLAACQTASAPSPAPAATYRPMGSELFQNPAFAKWSKGTPRYGGFGYNALSEQSGVIDAADHWVAKWTVSKKSRLVAKKDLAGMRYDFTAADAREAFYVRQYIGDAKWLVNKRFHLEAWFTCGANVTRSFWYLRFRWNNNSEDNPGVTVLAQSGSIAEGKMTVDLQTPPTVSGHSLDASAGLVPTLIVSTETTKAGWCIFKSMSAKQIP